MKPFHLISNKILRLVYKNTAMMLENSSQNLALTQEKYLMKLLQSNSDCIYGKINDFKSIRTPIEYQKRVPVISYEDCIPYIEEIKGGKKEVLCSQAINRFSMTSGTSSENKLIPSTNTLIKEFSNALGPWMYHNYRTFKGLSGGTSFWVITPAGDPPDIKSDVPVGFEEDSNYFPVLIRKVLQALMVLPDAVSKISDIENYYYVSAYFLLSSPELRMISVWNPSLLTILCQKVWNYSRELISDLGNGSLNPPSGLSGDESKQLKPFIKEQPKNAARLLEIFTKFQSDDLRIWAEIWPSLCFISCWTDGWAGDLLPQIRKLFPGVPIKGKGLLATEAIVSIPFAAGDPVLAATSHFFEFIDLKNHDVLFAHQLRKDEYYEVVVTTGGGLYRYRLNDIIQVTGFYHDLPQFRFIGKIDLYSDICGEKLHEYHVSMALKSVFQKYKIPGHTHFLVPHIIEGTALYLLFISEKDYTGITIDHGSLAKELDQKLRSNFHYDYCRKLGQLRLPGVVLMNDQMVEEYLSKKLEGIKPGTVKFPKLEKKESFSEIFSFTKEEL